MKTEIPRPSAGQRLPFGVLIPTRNCVSRLRKQLKALKEWIDCADEVVVVDSFSTDGTCELLRSELKHRAVRILQHPPGLYESWNHGIAQISAPWTYISTIGEVISPEGLLALNAAAAISPNIDVVISAPKFVTEDGRPVAGKRWPIHSVVPDSMPLEASHTPPAPRGIPQWSVFAISTLEAPQGILGSSAANLYKTECLRNHPFPTGYGHFGDTAWAIQNAFEVRCAVLPCVVSSFTLHESGGQVDRAKLEEVRDNLFDLAVNTLAAGPRVDGPIHETIVPLLKEFFSEFRQLRSLEEEYSRLRKVCRPWILKPGVWKARAQRNKRRSVVAQLKGKIYSVLRESAPINRDLNR